MSAAHQSEVAFRVDAGPEIGSGHVERCLVLADRLVARGYLAHFIVTDEMAGSRVRARGHRASVIHMAAGELADAARFLAVLGESAQVVVVDSYRLGLAWESEVAQAGRFIVALDDIGREHCCGVLLDASAASQERYNGRVPASCQIFAGPRYALLRDDYVRVLARPPDQRREVAGLRVAVSFGGSDPDDLTGMMIGALAALQHPHVGVDVVLGPFYGAMGRTAARCRKLGYAVHVAPDSLFPILRHATVAVGSAGMSAWERCALALPSVVVQAAENQTAVTEQLDAAAAALVVSLGTGEPLDEAQRALRFLIDAPDARCDMGRRAAGVLEGWIDVSGLIADAALAT